MVDNLKEGEKDKPFEKKEVFEDSVAMDASHIIDKIHGEIGMVGSERVAKNIENIRLAWRHDQSKAPTVSELEELAMSLQDGFTKRQLLDYFFVQSARPLDSRLELLSAGSTDLYKRSQWSPGSTPFPGDALNRLNGLMAEIEAQKGSGQVLKHSMKNLETRSNKRYIVDQILRQRWHLWTQEDLKSSGELDIWLSRDHLKVLLNHRRELLRGLSRQYEAHIDVSKSYAVLRVAADFDACGEVFKSILYLLENIHMNEINLPLDEFSVGQSAKREEMSIRSLLGQVEKVTSTAIKPLFNDRKVNASGEKLRIYHLGPGDEDLEDVRRVLSQTLRQTTTKTSVAFWTSSEKLQNAKPIPAETERSLPLVKRGKQWARWSCGTKRKSDSAKQLDGLKEADEIEQAEKKTHMKSKDSNSLKSAKAPGIHGKILRSLVGQAKECSLVNGPSIPGASGLPAQMPSPHTGSLPDLYWARSPARKTSAIFGHILYPLHASDRMKTGRKGPKTDPILRNNQTFINSRREILTSITSPRSYLQKSRLSNLRKREELRITLTPAQKKDLARPTRVFPGLMLYIQIDTDTKKATLAEVRLTLDEKEVDLLLPDEAADIRFLAESFLPAAEEVDPKIVKFFKASYLDVKGHQRLLTPKNLTLLVPAHAIRTLSVASADSTTANSGPLTGEAVKPGVSVEYIFTSLEHRSVVAGFDADSGFQMQYSFVEAGETGGRREELRIMFVRQQPINSKGIGQVHLRRDDNDHGHGDEGKEEPVVNQKRFKQFYDAAISLV